MTTFDSQLTAALAATTASDRQIVCRPCIKAEFLSATVRLWGGLGALKTPDGARWQGYYALGEDGEVQSLLDIPAIDDVRAGTSAPVTIRFGYLDAQSYALLRDSDEETDGRTLTIASVYLDLNSTVALSNPGNATRLKMVGRPGFSEKRQRQDDGSHRVLYSLTVKAVNLNAGRSRLGANVFTPIGHEFRSQLIHGVSGDLYAQFMPRYAGGVTLEL